MNIALEALWAIEKLVDESGGKENEALDKIWAIVQHKDIRALVSPYLEITNGSHMAFYGSVISAN